MRRIILYTCLCLTFLGGQSADGSSLAIGSEAKRKCKEANKKCPKDEVCAIQHLQWPMNMSFAVCVPAQYVRVKMRICDLPPQPGDCGARYLRWFYNKNIKECTLFFFQGCRGNQNNFKSKTECEENCIAHSDNSIQKSKTDFQSVRSPRIVTERLVGDQAVVSESNRIPVVSVRSRVTDPHQKELRRKRRLERKKLRQLKRSRRKGRKRRRDGKGKKGKKRKNRRRKKKKNKKKRKNKKNRRKKNKLNPTTEGPKIDLSNTGEKSKSITPKDFELISIIDKTKDTMKSSIEKIKSKADSQKD